MRTPAAKKSSKPARSRSSASPDRAKSKQRMSLVESAHRTLRKRILDHIYAPGCQVLEQDLAAELGISRTPLREALLRLENERLIVVVPRHGMRVLPVSATDMKEIYEVLTALETAAIELVIARRPSRAELQSMISASQDMATALARDDLKAWAEADERFHASLIDLAGNGLLKETVFRSWDRAHRARLVTLQLRPKPVHSTKEHLALVECILRGDSDEAVRVNRAHRARGSQELLEILQRFQLQGL